jgi:hypothetical protein
MRSDCRIKRSVRLKRRRRSRLPRKKMTTRMIAISRQLTIQMNMILTRKIQMNPARRKMMMTRIHLIRILIHYPKTKKRKRRIRKSISSYQLVVVKDQHQKKRPNTTSISGMRMMTRIPTKTTMRSVTRTTKRLS